MNCIRHSTDCVYMPSEASSQMRQQTAQSKSPLITRDASGRMNDPHSAPTTILSPDLGFEDLELLHQYVMCTSIATSQLPAVTKQMQVLVPRLAQEHHFMMRGILTKAAVHLSWLRPSRKEHYTLLAAKHHSIALPHFRSALAVMDRKNYYPLIVYSKGLVWCSFAWCEPFSGLTRMTPSEENWLPSWFYLLLGSCLIVKSCKSWIESGSHLLLPALDDLTEYSKSSDCIKMLTLISSLDALSGSSVCPMVLSALSEAFARASMRHHNTPLRNAINFWVGMLPNDDLDSVHKGEPWALVVLAHFSVLIFRSETRWLMKGHARRLLGLILLRLKSTWLQCVQWPLMEVSA